MPITLRMPALSPTMEEGNLTSWSVKIGDKIEPGDIIAEIETDKATMDFEAVDEGVIVHILVDAGSEGVKVNAPIAILAEPDEDISKITADADAGAAPQASTPSPADTAALAPTASTTSAQVSTALPKGERVYASPLAKRIANDAGVNMATIKGTGPRGRIVKSDVEAAVGSGPTRVATTAPSQAGSLDSLIMPQILDDRVYPKDSYRLEPLDGMRRIVARRLTESFMQVPHFPLQIDLRIDALLAARKEMNSSAPDGVKISVNDMLIKACALALLEEPNCNASYSDEGIAYHNSANISVAVAVEGGLITPVVRDAQTKGLQAISSEMKDLAARARTRKLKPQEYSGGTFSISNLGMFGIKSFGSIINPPEGMILSIGAGEKRPIYREDGAIQPATVMSVTLTCDHRVIGGAEGAKWLQAFKRFIEMPASMLL